MALLDEKSRYTFYKDNPGKLATYTKLSNLYVN